MGDNGGTSPTDLQRLILAQARAWLAAFGREPWFEELATAVDVTGDVLEAELAILRARGWMSADGHLVIAGTGLAVSQGMDLP